MATTRTSARGAGLYLTTGAAAFLLLAWSLPSAVADDSQRPTSPSAGVADVMSQVVRGSGELPAVDEETAEFVEAMNKTTDDEPMRPEEMLQQIEFQVASTEIETAHPDLFVAAPLASQSDASGADYILYLTDRPTEDIVETLEKLPGVTEIRYGGPVRVSIKDQDAVFAAALRAARTVPAVDPNGATARLNSENTGLVVEVASRAGELAGADRAALARIIGSGVAAATKFDLSVEIQQINRTAGGLENNVIGGRNLNVPGGGPLCTAGFTAARQNNGARGVVTARHCRNDLNYRGTNGIIDYLGPAAGLGGSVIDLQFHRTLSPHTTQARFQWASSSQIKTVDRFGNPRAGQRVCHHGVPIEFDCANVLYENQCVTVRWRETGGNYVDVCRLVRANEWITRPGSSGGPWFIDDAASGIHSIGDEENNRSFFSRIGSVGAFLNSDVLTG